MALLVGNDFSFGMLEGTYRQSGDKLTIDAAEFGSGPRQRVEYILTWKDDSHVSLDLGGKPHEFVREGEGLETVSIASLTKGKVKKPPTADSPSSDPTADTTKEDQSATTCMANLKQLGMATAMYTQDYDGFLADSHSWSDALLPYLKFKEVMTCPEVKQGGYEGGYAMDATLSGIEVAKNARPADTTLFFESSMTGLNVSDAQTSLIARPRHADGFHFTYLDGHAGAKP